MISLPMAAPFVVLVAATVAAVLGLRRTSVVIWVVALALLVYAFAGHVTDAINIAL